MKLGGQMNAAQMTNSMTRWHHSVWNRVTNLQSEQV